MMLVWETAFCSADTTSSKAAPFRIISRQARISSTVLGPVPLVSMTAICLSGSSSSTMSRARQALPKLPDRAAEMVKAITGPGRENAS